MHPGGWFDGMFDDVPRGWWKKPAADAAILAALAALMALCIAGAGCVLPKELEFNRASEPRRPLPPVQVPLDYQVRIHAPVIEGLGIERIGKVLRVTWSAPAENRAGPFPLRATGRCVLKVKHPASGAPAVYTSPDAEPVEVAPGRVRLVSGVFEIPRAALAGRDADESIGPTIHVDTVRFELDVREVRPGPEPTMRTLRCRVTAYCPCARCCDEMTGRTATGTNAWRPGVASDWAALPAGTRVRIEGYGVAEVDDTGAAMRRSWRDRGEVHLDVRMTYHWQARQWGSRWMDVEVLGG